MKAYRPYSAQALSDPKIAEIESAIAAFEAKKGIEIRPMLEIDGNSIRAVITFDQVTV